MEYPRSVAECRLSLKLRWVLKARSVMSLPQSPTQHHVSEGSHGGRCRSQTSISNIDQEVHRIRTTREDLSREPFQQIQKGPHTRLRKHVARALTQEPFAVERLKCSWMDPLANKHPGRRGSLCESVDRGSLRQEKNIESSSEQRWLRRIDPQSGHSRRLRSSARSSSIRPLNLSNWRCRADNLSLACSKSAVRAACSVACRA